MTYHIGIDPGSGANNGCALIDDTECIVSMRTGIRNAIVDHVRLTAEQCSVAGDELIVHVEDPRLIPTIYGRNRTANPGLNRRIAQNVGMNKGVTAAIIEDIEALGITVHRHAPSGAKWDAATVRALGWTGRSSQHARDALRVALQGKRKCEIEQRTKKEV